MGLAYTEFHRTCKGLYGKSLPKSPLKLAMMTALKKAEDNICYRDL